MLLLSDTIDCEYPNLIIGLKTQPSLGQIIITVIGPALKVCLDLKNCIGFVQTWTTVFHLLEYCIEHVDPGWSTCLEYECVSWNPNGGEDVMNILTAVITIITILTFAIGMIYGYKQDCKQQYKCKLYLLYINILLPLGHLRIYRRFFGIPYRAFAAEADLQENEDSRGQEDNRGPEDEDTGGQGNNRGPSDVSPMEENNPDPLPPPAAAEGQDSTSHQDGAHGSDQFVDVQLHVPKEKVPDMAMAEEEVGPFTLTRDPQPSLRASKWV